MNVNGITTLKGDDVVKEYKVTFCYYSDHEGIQAESEVEAERIARELEKCRHHVYYINPDDVLVEETTPTDEED